MGVGENDCGRGNGTEAAEPIRSAIHHDACVAVLDKQGTVTPMPIGPDVNLAARTEECQVHHCRVLRPHLRLMPLTTDRTNPLAW
jgi:hypothetical protein